MRARFLILVAIGMIAAGCTVTSSLPEQCNTKGPTGRGYGADKQLPPPWCPIGR